MWKESRFSGLVKFLEKALRVEKESIETRFGFYSFVFTISIFLIVNFFMLMEIILMWDNSYESPIGRPFAVIGASFFFLVFFVTAIVYFSFPQNIIRTAFMIISGMIVVGQLVCLSFNVDSLLMIYPYEMFLSIAVCSYTWESFVTFCTVLITAVCGMMGTFLKFNYFPTPQKIYWDFLMNKINPYIIITRHTYHLSFLLSMYYVLLVVEFNKKRFHRSINLFSKDIQNHSKHFLKSLEGKPEEDFTKIERTLYVTSQTYGRDMKLLPTELRFRTFTQFNDMENEDSSMHSGGSSHHSRFSNNSGSINSGHSSIMSDVSRHRKTSRHSSDIHSVQSSELSRAENHIDMFKKDMYCRNVMTIVFNVSGLDRFFNVGYKQRQANKTLTAVLGEFSQILHNQIMTKDYENALFLHHVYGTRFFCTVSSLRYIVDCEKRAATFVFEIHEKFKKHFQGYDGLVLRAVILKVPLIMGFVMSENYNQFIFSGIPWDLLFYLTAFCDYLDIEMLVDHHVQRKVKYNISETKMIERIVYNGSEIHFYTLKGSVKDLAPKMDEWLYEIQGNLTKSDEDESEALLSEFWENLEKDKEKAKVSIERAKKYLPERVYLFLKELKLKGLELWTKNQHVKPILID